MNKKLTEQAQAKDKMVESVSIVNGKPFTRYYPSKPTSSQKTKTKTTRGGSHADHTADNALRHVEPTDVEITRGTFIQEPKIETPKTETVNFQGKTLTWAEALELALSQL